MLKKKKLTIVLLLITLGLGLVWLVYAATPPTAGDPEQIVTATIAPTLILEAPTDLEAAFVVGTNLMQTGYGPGQDINDLEVWSNTPYSVTIAQTLGPGGVAGHMQVHDGNIYVTPAITLTNPFRWRVISHEGISDPAAPTAFAAITTADATVVAITDPSTGTDGFLVDLEYEQEVVFGDPVLPAAQRYRMVLAFTATPNAP